MTNEEAISWLRTAMSCAEELCEYEKEAFEMAEKALEKQIPKKPIIETISASTNESPLIVGFCPNCITARPMVTNRYDLYCRSCGQALDWESGVTENDG